MDYASASSQLTGRCIERRKLANNTYLIRRSDTEIAVRLHSTDVLTFHVDGSIEVSTGGWNTVTTVDRINRYLSRPWRVWRESSRMFIGNGFHDNAQVASFGTGVIINADGTFGIGALDAETVRDEIRRERNEAAKPRRKLRYWLAKAREGKPFKGTVDDIMGEANASIRLAKMKCYGMDRFFLDAKPDVIDTYKDYQLLKLELGSWESAIALKMTCPSTGAVYINTVPANITRVPAALDWMFDTKDYLGQVTQTA